MQLKNPNGLYENPGHHWLSVNRIRVYSLAIAVAYFVYTLAKIWFSIVSETKTIPPNLDFSVFYVASELALAGSPQDAYNPILLNELIKNIFPDFSFNFRWMYPVTFYLVIVPLGLLPYLGSYLAFTFITLACFVVAVRGITKDRVAMLCLAAYPGVWVNIGLGQNGFLTASLAAGVMLNLKRRPILAGVFLGLLSMKPHLALLFPVALIAIGAWKTLFTGGVVAIIFSVLSTLVLGRDAFEASITSTYAARELLEHGGLWGASPTVFSFLRLLNISVGAAYGAQMLFLVVGVASLWKIWRTTDSWALRGSALMTASFFISPYLLSHDLVWLAFPIAWFAQIGIRNGWLSGEREVLLAVWLLPLIMPLIADHLFIQIGPFVFMAMLWIIARRTHHSPSSLHS